MIKISLKKDYFKEKEHEVAKNVQKRLSFIQEERESKNIRRESLDVSPQAQEKSNIVPL